jgi:cysteine desulfurase
MGVYVSAGSACSKGKHSKTLAALGLPTAIINSALRASLSLETTRRDIDALIDGLRAIAS